MAASKVKELLDELAATLAEMGMLEEQEGEPAEETAMEGDEAMPAAMERSAEARQAKYDDLLAKAERIKSAIAKEEAREARKAELAVARKATEEMKERTEYERLKAKFEVRFEITAKILGPEPGQ